MNGLDLHARTIAVAGPEAATVWIGATDGALRRLRLGEASVERVAVAPVEVRLVAASPRGALLVRDVAAGAVRIVSAPAVREGWPGIELGVRPVRSAVFVADDAVVVAVGSSALSAFAVASGERLWTRPLPGLGECIAASADGRHLAAAAGDAVNLVEVEGGRVVDHIALTGLRGFAVDARWRHWALWRASEPAIHRVGRDAAVERWRFEQVTLARPPTAAAAFADGTLVVGDGKGRLTRIERAGRGPEQIAERGAALRAVLGVRAGVQRLVVSVTERDSRLQLIARQP